MGRRYGKVDCDVNVRYLPAKRGWEEIAVAVPGDITFEPKMLIDGKLVDAASGKTFANVNPATEEVLGEVADADSSDMDSAIDAARRAFDGTDWSTNHALRKRCLEQLQHALEAEQEQLREELIREV